MPVTETLKTKHFIIANIDNLVRFGLLRDFRDAQAPFSYLDPLSFVLFGTQDKKCMLCPCLKDSGHQIELTRIHIADR